jgi:hypothetical protein
MAGSAVIKIREMTRAVLGAQIVTRERRQNKEKRINKNK